MQVADDIESGAIGGGGIGHRWRFSHRSGSTAWIRCPSRRGGGSLLVGHRGGALGQAEETVGSVCVAVDPVARFADVSGTGDFRQTRTFRGNGVFGQQFRAVAMLRSASISAGSAVRAHVCFVETQSRT